MVKWGKPGSAYDAFGHQMTYSKCGRFAIIRHGESHYELFKVKDGNLTQDIGRWGLMRYAKDYADYLEEKGRA